MNHDLEPRSFLARPHAPEPAAGLARREAELNALSTCRHDWITERETRAADTAQDAASHQATAGLP